MSRISQYSTEALALAGLVWLMSHPVPGTADVLIGSLCLATVIAVVLYRRYLQAQLWLSLRFTAFKAARGRRKSVHRHSGVARRR